MACGATLSLKRTLDFDPVHDSGSERSLKRRRCMPFTMSGAAPPTKQHQINRSLFTPISSKITSEEIAAQLSAQIKRMQRRRQLSVISQIGDDTVSSEPSSSHQKPKTLDKDVPMFTQKQMTLLCERMIREKENELGEQYGKALSSKLAEQYDAFLKFNEDEFHRQFNESAASYVS